MNKYTRKLSISKLFLNADNFTDDLIPILSKRHNIPIKVLEATLSKLIKYGKIYKQDNIYYCKRVDSNIKSLPFSVGKKPSENNITAELYHQLRLLKIPVYLEYFYDNCRFDMVLLNKDFTKVIAIVEIKSFISEYRETSYTRQYNKYQKYGLPLLYCTHKKNIKSTISKLEEIYSNYGY